MAPDPSLRRPLPDVTARGALHLAAATLVAAPCAQGRALWALLAGVAVLAAWVEPHSFRNLLSRGFLTLALTMAAVTATGDGPGGSWAPVVARAAVLVLAFGVLGRRASPSALATLASRLRLGDFGLALGIAVNSLDSVRHTATGTWHALRLRGALRAGPVRCARLYAVTVLGCILARADTVALAAESRGYGLYDRPAQLRPATGADVQLAVAAWTLAVTALATRLVEA